MGYHTHFYAHDIKEQNEWAKLILNDFQELFHKKMNSIPSDDLFKQQHQMIIESVSDEKYQKFKHDSIKDNWSQDNIDKNEKFFAKYRNPNYTWEDDKREYIQRLETIKSTGILKVFFDSELDFSEFLIRNHEILKSLNNWEIYDYEIKDGKIYSGEIFRRCYRVDPRYCESMWFNSNGIIDVIKDYSDRTLTDEQVQEIKDFVHKYPDWYCFII